MKRQAANESEGARSQRRKAEGKGAAALNGEVRDSPFPSLGFIDLREPRSPNRARCAH
jgi:hypothetical protein